jgi:hypothetical protein
MGFGQSLASSVRYEQRGIGTGIGTTVTSNASANTKGSYVSIGSAISFDYDGIFLNLVGLTGNASRRFRIDLAVNNGGSDQIIVEDLLLEYQVTPAPTVQGILIPIFVPSGGQLKARCQDITGSGTIALSLNGIQGDCKMLRGFRALKTFTDWTNTDPTGSVALTGTTQTAWTEIISSSLTRCAGLFVSFDNRGTTGPTSTGIVVDIGWGAAASERVLFRFNVSGGLEGGKPTIGPFPCDFPAGTRFAFRAQGQAADTNTISIALNGLVP